MDRVYKIRGVVQHYSWGGDNFIPQLLGTSNVSHQPFAEYWLGAHPKSPAIVEKENIALDQFVQRYPIETLGTVHCKFDSLPFLFKILDVKQMLSIQVHPSKTAAEEEYEKENEKGVAIAAPHRNYKDSNHKPELMVALSDFWLLHGFKKSADLQAVLHKVPELQFLVAVFEEEGYKGLYEKVMTMPQQKVNEVLGPLLARIIPLYKAAQLSKDEEDFWAARAALTFCKDNQYDRGIFSIYLFNLLHLKEGEAIYQPAGLPHAYLEGQNVEVMANSDNVLRAGLTDKHVDVAELLKHVQFEATHPKIIPSQASTEQGFPAPVEEFDLKRYLVAHSFQFSTSSATILFVYAGNGKVLAGDISIDVKRGEAVLVLAGQDVVLQSSGETLDCYSVSAPPDKN